MTRWLSSERGIRDESKSYNDLHVMDVPFVAFTVLYRSRRSAIFNTRGDLPKDVRAGKWGSLEATRKAANKCLQ